MMLNVLSEYFCKNFRINEIEFGEDDSELNEEIKMLLHKIDSDRANFHILLKKLECIGENSSIDIVKIRMTNLHKVGGKYPTFSLRVNGILSVNENTLATEKEILKIIKEDF